MIAVDSQLFYQTVLLPGLLLWQQKQRAERNHLWQNVKTNVTIAYFRVDVSFSARLLCLIWALYKGMPTKQGARCPTFTPPPSTVTAASLRASVSLIWRRRCTATNTIAQIMDSFSKLSSDEPAWWGSHHDCSYTISLSIITPINLKNIVTWGTPKWEGVCRERRKERNSIDAEKAIKMPIVVADNTSWKWHHQWQWRKGEIKQNKHVWYASLTYSSKCLIQGLMFSSELRDGRTKNTVF